ncbi:MAG: hypothetical protein WC082_09585 [Victivallales bacterium]|jgi:hypothetical protein
MDNIGKRLLHAICGFIVGFGLGFIIGLEWLAEYITRCCLIGAFFCAVAAFFLTDEFWEKLGEHLKKW